MVGFGKIKVSGHAPFNQFLLSGRSAVNFWLVEWINNGWPLKETLELHVSNQEPFGHEGSWSPFLHCLLSLVQLDTEKALSRCFPFANLEDHGPFWNDNAAKTFFDSFSSFIAWFLILYDVSCWTLEMGASFSKLCSVN